MGSVMASLEGKRAALNRAMVKGQISTTEASKSLTRLYDAYEPRFVFALVRDDQGLLDMKSGHTWELPAPVRDEREAYVEDEQRQILDLLSYGATRREVSVIFGVDSDEARVKIAEALALVGMSEKATRREVAVAWHEQSGGIHSDMLVGQLAALRAQWPQPLWTLDAPTPEPIPLEGQPLGKWKLTFEQRCGVRADYYKGEGSYAHLAKKYGVTKGTIQRVIHELEDKP